MHIEAAGRAPTHILTASRCARRCRAVAIATSVGVGNNATYPRILGRLHLNYLPINARALPPA